MPRSKSSKQNKRALGTLMEKGILASIIGLAFLIAPMFVGTSAVLKSIAPAFRTPGWIALGVGVVLLGLHFLMKSRADKKTTDLQAVRGKPANIDKPSTLGNVVPVNFRENDTQAKQAHPCTALTPPSPATAWSPAVFSAIEWRRFEAVCEALFAQAGFSTRAQSHGADGGVDIWLHSAHAQGPVGVVQCKHWQGKPVGVKEVREFFGVMASHQLKRGTYATTSTYTADAKQFAKDNSINALDGPALLALIAKRTPEQQQALLAIAYEGDYWRPTCASCGTKMVERAPAKGGAGFWGCAGYPKCRRTMQMAA
jgi:restriction system protein